MFISLRAGLSAQTTLRYDSLTPAFAWVTDSVAKLNGLANLRSGRSANISREIRLWVGFGMVPPHLLLRVADSAGTLVGQRIAWWDGEEDSADRREHVICSLQCTDKAIGRGMESCRLPPMSPATIRTIWQLADSLDAWRLPDPMQLSPEGQSGTDGTSIMVEVRTTPGYRTYDYWEPDSAPWPEAKRAAVLMRFVYSVFRSR